MRISRKIQEYSSVWRIKRRDRVAKDRVALVVPIFLAGTRPIDLLIENVNERDPSLLLISLLETRWSGNRSNFHLSGAFPAPIRCWGVLAIRKFLSPEWCKLQSSVSLKLQDLRTIAFVGNIETLQKKKKKKRKRKESKELKELGKISLWNSGCRIQEQSDNLGIRGVFRRTLFVERETTKWTKVN